MEYHERLVERAIAMGACDVHVSHCGTRRPHLTGVIDGVHFMLALPLRPKDLRRNFFASLRDLRRIIRRIRSSSGEGR